MHGQQNIKKKMNGTANNIGVSVKAVDVDLGNTWFKCQSDTNWSGSNKGTVLT